MQLNLKLKKNFQYYLIFWSILAAAFFVLSLLYASGYHFLWIETTYFRRGFWMLIFGIPSLVMYAAQLFCGYMVFQRWNYDRKIQSMHLQVSEVLVFALFCMTVGAIICNQIPAVRNGFGCLILLGGLLVSLAAVFLTKQPVEPENNDSIFFKYTPESAAAARRAIKESAGNGTTAHREAFPAGRDGHTHAPLRFYYEYQGSVHAKCPVCGRELSFKRIKLGYQDNIYFINGRGIECACGNRTDKILNVPDSAQEHSTPDTADDTSYSSAEPFYAEAGSSSYAETGNTGTADTARASATEAGRTGTTDAARASATETGIDDAARASATETGEAEATDTGKTDAAHASQGIFDLPPERLRFKRIIYGTICAAGLACVLLTSILCSSSIYTENYYNYDQHFSHEYNYGQFDDDQTL